MFIPGRLANVLIRISIDADPFQIEFLAIPGQFQGYSRVALAIIIRTYFCSTPFRPDSVPDGVGLKSGDYDSESWCDMIVASLSLE